MGKKSRTTEKSTDETRVEERFLQIPDGESFADLFNAFTPQLVAFFRARNCDLALAEDLTQEVMLIVYRKAWQLRDRASFRAWLYKVARHALCRHYNKQTREVETVNLMESNDGLPAVSPKPAGTPAFEFLQWMAYLDIREREVMRLRFVEQWEYHEIAAALAIPIGTVQWRVFNAKKKLVPHLTVASDVTRKAA
jgi:RNA polymerase sigma-70 factor (ECF subfamily)